MNGQIRVTLSVTAWSLERALDLLVTAAKDAKKEKGQNIALPWENKWEMWGHISSQRFSYLYAQPHVMTGNQEFRMEPKDDETKKQLENWLDEIKVGMMTKTEEKVDG